MFKNETPQPDRSSRDYDFEEQLVDQLEKLPKPEGVEELFSVLRVAALRELSVEVVNSAIEYMKSNGDRLEHVKLINSWLATAEETVVAGRNLNRIVARRKKQS